MRHIIQLLIVSFVLFFYVPVYAITIGGVYGDSDVIVDQKLSSNSSEDSELRFLLGLADTADVSEYSLLKYESEDDGWALWTKVLDRDNTEADVYAFDFYDFLDGFEPLKFIIKTGANVEYNGEESNTFLYDNFDARRYAVIDLDDFDRTDGSVEIQMVSHVSAPAPVPEPSTLLLLGAGITGLAFYRRKKH